MSSTSTYYEAWDAAMRTFILDVFQIVKGDPVASRSVWERLPCTWHGDLEIVDKALSLNLIVFHGRTLGTYTLTHSAAPVQLVRCFTQSANNTMSASQGRFLGRGNMARRPGGRHLTLTAIGIQGDQAYNKPKAPTIH